MSWNLVKKEIDPKDVLISMKSLKSWDVVITIGGVKQNNIKRMELTIDVDEPSKMVVWEWVDGNNTGNT
jgi:hypothetical protein